MELVLWAGGYLGIKKIDMNYVLICNDENKIVKWISSQYTWVFFFKSCRYFIVDNLLIIIIN